MKLTDALDQFEGSLSASSGKYLKFDQDSTEWSVVELNCFEKFIRWIGLGYGSTTLKHIATQINREDCDFPAVNRIHELWQKTYPDVRNPLKLEPFTKKNPASPEILGNVQMEVLLAGTTHLYLSADTEQKIQTLGGGFKLDTLTFVEGQTNEARVDGIIKKLETANQEVTQLAFKWNFVASKSVVKQATQMVLSTIETYLKENPENQLTEIVIYFEPDKEDFLPKAIDACRSMQHPHAQFFEIPQA